MDGEGAALVVGDVGRGVVEGLAVVQGDAAGGQGDDGGLRMIDLVAHVEEGAGVGGAFVLLRTEVGAGDELHGAVVDVDVVES